MGGATEESKTCPKSGITILDEVSLLALNHTNEYGPLGIFQFTNYREIRQLLMQDSPVAVAYDGYRLGGYSSIVTVKPDRILYPETGFSINTDMEMQLDGSQSTLCISDFVPSYALEKIAKGNEEHLTKVGLIASSLGLMSLGLLSRLNETKSRKMTRRDFLKLASKFIGGGAITALTLSNGIIAWSSYITNLEATSMNEECSSGRYRDTITGQDETLIDVSLARTLLSAEKIKQLKGDGIVEGNLYAVFGITHIEDRRILTATASDLGPLIDSTIYRETEFLAARVKSGELERDHAINMLTSFLMDISYSFPMRADPADPGWAVSDGVGYGVRTNATLIRPLEKAHIRDILRNLFPVATDYLDYSLRLPEK